MNEHDQEIWEALVGSDFATCESFITFVLGNTPDTPSDLNLGYLTAEGEESETNLTFDEIKEAYDNAINGGETHCGGYLLADLDNNDACFAHIVLQYALYGEVIYS
jgi:hypothetical protein